MTENRRSAANDRETDSLREAASRAAARLYDPLMPYHNFQHARDVAEEGERIVARCLREGIPVDADVVFYACLFHDAGYHEDHLALGFSSKEAYSAHLAEVSLLRFGVPAGTIGRVAEAILATHCDARCDSNESKAVRAADLSGLALDYLLFRTNAIRLKREYEMMSGTQVPWENWKKQSCNRLELFLREHLDLTSDYFDQHGNSVFHLRARENIRLLMADPGDAD
jgi:HD superfamily phosphodiesterase